MDWNDKRVVIMGLARQGRALIDALSRRGAHILVTDLKSREQLADDLQNLPASVSFHLGSHPAALLDDAEAVFVSGGVPADLPFILEAQGRGIRVLNDSELFLEEVRAPVIGITGSAGKSTTTSLTGHILHRHLASEGRKVWVGGNIGNPLVGQLDEINEHDLVVLELSSFQLEIMDRSPQTAAVLNISPNHLDRHKTVENYLEAKSRILQFQSAESWAVLGWDDDRIRDLGSTVRGHLAGFGKSLRGVDGVILDEEGFKQRWLGRETAICSSADSPLRGKHNLWNIAAAFTLCTVKDVPPEVMQEGLRDFQSLPHRLEEIGWKREILWVNDSIATTPARAAAALRAFTEPLVVLVGGRDKGVSWQPFIEAAGENVEQVILFGEGAELIRASLNASLGCLLSLVSTLDDAVEKAAVSARKGSVVLLSPGCSSFDAFPDFEFRGDHFRELVRSI